MISKKAWDCRKMFIYNNIFCHANLKYKLIFFMHENRHCKKIGSCLHSYGYNHDFQFLTLPLMEAKFFSLKYRLVIWQTKDLGKEISKNFEKKNC